MKPKDPNSISFARKILGPVAIAALGTLSLGGCSAETEAHGKVIAVAATERVEFPVDKVVAFSGLLDIPSGALPATVSSGEEIRKADFEVCDPWEGDFYDEYDAKNDTILDAKESGFNGESIKITDMDSYTETREDYSDEKGKEVEAEVTCYRIDYIERVKRFWGKLVEKVVNLRICENKVWRSEVGFSQVPDNKKCVEEALKAQNEYARKLPEGAKTYSPEKSNRNYVRVQVYSNEEGEKKENNTVEGAISSKIFS
jgi:hypothetical protein